jgi:uncharacterized cupredoxin-like copper-binding protein
MNYWLSGFVARRLRLAAVLCLLAFLAACGAGNAVNVQYHGYRIAPSPASIKTGDVTFNLNNQDGQVLHEFVVAQTDLPADKLPLGSDAKVDETQLKIVARGSKLDVGQSGTLTANLPPGHYVLLCNIVGHYQLGMHADFTVTP